MRGFDSHRPLRDSKGYPSKNDVITQNRTTHLFSWVEHNHLTILATLVLLLILAGGLYSLRLGNNLRFQDERDFYAIAKNLISGKGYSIDGITPTAYRPPGYPLLMAIFAKLGAGVFWFRMLNFLFLAGTMVLLFFIAQKELTPLAGVITAIIILCYPVLFFTASTLYAQTLGMLLLISTIFLLNYWQIPTEKRAVFFGVVTGFIQGWLMLTIPGLIPTSLLAAVWFYFARKDIPFTRRIGTMIVMLLVGFAVLFSWSIRNYRTFGKFILMTTHDGITLLHGNSEFATPNSGAATDISQYLPGAIGLNEVEQNEYFRSQAIQWILNNKGKAFKLYLLKLLNWFNYRNQLAQKSEQSKARDLLMLLSYGPLLLLLLIRLAFARRFKLSRIELLFLLLYIANAFTYAVFHTRIRYRLPFDAGIIAVVGIFLARLFKSYFPNFLMRSDRRAMR